MTISIHKTSRKREITSGTREWADHNVNCVKGCSNDCRYCYARMMAKRFGRCKEHDWKEMVVNRGAVDRKYGKYNGRVMFPSTHDITGNKEVQRACFTVIRKLLEAGNEVLITTKPSLDVVDHIVEDFDSFREQLQFRFTITSINDQLLSFWEPNAPGFEERFASLKYTHAKEFKTSVSIEPFLDYQPRVLIDMLLPYVTESIWLGPMNYIAVNGISDDIKRQYEEIRRRYETAHLEDIYNDLRVVPKIRFKDSMSNRLGILKVCT